MLQRDGKKILWLADQTGYGRSYVRSVLRGYFNPSASFRLACARVMGRPESELFLPSASSSRPYRRQKREVA
jgi:transcriptional regulator with XRE-family HTH domain